MATKRVRKYIRKTTDRKAPPHAFKPGYDPRRFHGARGPNRVSTDIKNALVAALEKAGGAKGAQGYFEVAAKRDSRSFMALIGKLLPTKLAGEEGSPIQIEQVHKIQAGLSKLSNKEIDTLLSLLQKAGVDL